MKPNSILNIATAIQETYPESIPIDESQEAARNLAGFFSLLLEIDREQAAVNKGGNNAYH